MRRKGLTKIHYFARINICTMLRSFFVLKYKEIVRKIFMQGGI
jgi:hypothetical protein